MNTLMPRAPLYKCSAEEVNRRVAYQYVRLHYREAISQGVAHPPAVVLTVAIRARKAGFSYLYWSLRWYATNLAHGFTMAELRELGPDRAHRALHKRKPRTP